MFHPRREPTLQQFDLCCSLLFFVYTRTMTEIENVEGRVNVGTVLFMYTLRTTVHR